MKTLILVLMFVFSYLTAFSQAQKEATANKNIETNSVQKEAGAKPDQQPFIDKNLDGVNDKTFGKRNDNPNKPKMNGKQDKNKNCDKFIDKNGDGINDSKCKGMGLGCGIGKEKKPKRGCK